MKSVMALYVCLLIVLPPMARAQDVKPTAYSRWRQLSSIGSPIGRTRLHWRVPPAPPSISADAEVLVLGSQGYETAVKGKNGFVCFVERSWTAGSMIPSSGIRSCARPIASTPRPCVACCRNISSGPHGCWLVTPNSG